MKAALVGAVWVAGSLLVGCGHVEVKDVVLRADDGRGSHSRALLYMTGQKVPRPVYEVALLDATGTGDSGSIEAITGALLDRGTQLGCDAVVRVHIELGRTSTHAYGVCVRYAPVAAAPL